MMIITYLTRSSHISCLFSTGSSLFSVDVALGPEMNRGGSGRGGGGTRGAGIVGSSGNIFGPAIRLGSVEPQDDLRSSRERCGSWIVGDKERRDLLPLPREDGE